MKTNHFIKTISLFAFCTLVFSCSSGGGDTEEPPIIQKNPPAKAVGVLPENGEPCSDFEVIPDDDTKVEVAFSWNSAQFAESYVLTIFDGSTEVHRNVLNTTSTEVRLDRGKTYSWRVISVNGDGETNGDTLSFTTPGNPVGNYAPYAAQITIEFNSDTLEMSVFWEGNDEDGDSLTYDITVLEDEILLLEELDFTNDSLDTIIYKPGRDYSIEVISKDSSGNFSISRVSIEAPE